MSQPSRPLVLGPCMRWGTSLATSAAIICAERAASADELTTEAAKTLELQVVADTLTAPTGFAFLPDGSIVVTQKAGQLAHVVAGAVTPIGQIAVDTESEKGLLNVLVPPDYEQRPRLILYYSAIGADVTDEDRNRVVSIDVGGDGRLDLASEQILVRGIHGPRNHAGGGMTIGPDGYLYVGVGDSGCDSPQNANPTAKPSNFFASCLSNPNGKLLRVSLDGEVPSDNPFFGEDGPTCGAICGEDAAALPASPARAEIFAFGFRNPWRIWSDPVTGFIWAGDVGGSRFEEIDVIKPADKGQHYGWPWREAFTGYPLTQCEAWNEGQACRDPVYACAHPGFETTDIEGGCGSITGGVIADNCTWPAAWRNHYVFGDNDTDVKKLYALRVNATRDGVVPASRKELVQSTGLPVHIALGPEGDVYYAVIGGSGSSQLLRLTARSNAPVDAECEPPGAAGSGGGGGSNSEAGAGPTTGGVPTELGPAGAAGSGESAGGNFTEGGAQSAGAGGPPSGSPAGAGDDGNCGCALPGGGRGAWSGFVVLLGLGFLGARAGSKLRRRASRRASKRPTE